MLESRLFTRKQTCLQEDQYRPRQRRQNNEKVLQKEDKKYRKNNNRTRETEQKENRKKTKKDKNDTGQKKTDYSIVLDDNNHKLD